MTLVATEWLGEHLGEHDIRIADASWYLPEAKRNAHAEYEQRHIPGAVFFDIDAISNPATTLPHMLPDAALFSAVNDKAEQTTLAQAAKKIKKIVIFDSPAVDPTPFATYVGSNAAAEGRVTADTLAKLVGGKGTVLEVDAAPGFSTLEINMRAFRDQMKKYPKIKMLPTLYDNDLPATAASQIQSTLAAHPDLGGVFAGNTNTGQGIATGLKQAGKQGAVKVAAFDAEPDEVASLKAGTLQVLVAQDPASIGREAVDQLAAAFEGKSAQKSIGTNMVAITNANMNDPSVSKYFYKSGC